MSTPRAAVWLLAAFIATAAGQGGPPGNPFTFGQPTTAVAATTSTISTPTTSAVTTSSPTTAQAASTTSQTSSSTTSTVETSASSTSSLSSSNTANTAQHTTQVGTPVASSSPSTAVSSSVTSTTSIGASSQNGLNTPSGSGNGMSSSEKIGVGVGVGVGLAVLAALAVLIFFLLRRRRSRGQDLDTSAEKLHDVPDRPAMASGVPALAGAAVFGRSSSNASSNASSQPRTPSQRSSVANVPATPADATVEPKSLRSIPRAPPALVLPSQMPDKSSEAPGYHDDWLMDEPPRAVSPVSFSPADSRPPSPLSQDDR